MLWSLILISDDLTEIDEAEMKLLIEIQIKGFVCDTDCKMYFLKIQFRSIFFSKYGETNLEQN